MIQELLYTSAPQGLLRGTSGFCTVAATAKMSPTLMQKLESLSGYRHLFPPSDPRAARNPINWSHLRLMVGGRNFHVLSRVGFAGRDYTNRTNHIAHHVVLDASDNLPEGGPAWLLRQPGFMHAEWDGQMGTLPPTGPLALGSSVPRVCSAWQRRTGDAGWAGQVAEWFSNDPSQQVYLVFDQDTDSDLLPLVDEALSLLPPQLRWAITFSTYYIGTQSVTCALRGLANGSAEAQRAASAPQAKVLNLVTAASRQRSVGPFAEAARTGIAPALSPKLDDKAEWPSDWELEAAPIPVPSPHSRGSEAKRAANGGMMQPNREFDFAHPQPANDPTSQLPPAIPQRARFSDSSWTLGLSSLALILLLGLGTTIFYIFSPTSPQNGEESGLSDSPTAAARSPRPTIQRVQDLQADKFEAANKKLKDQLAAAEKRSQENNDARQQLVETLNNYDQSMQVMCEDLTAAWRELAIKDKELKVAERKLQEQIAKSKNEQGVASEQKSREANKDVEAGIRPATNGPRPSHLKKVGSYCALPPLRLPNGTINLNKPEQLKFRPNLQLDFFKKNQLKLRPPAAQDASHVLRLAAQPGKDSHEVLVGPSESDKETSVAKFVLNPNEITFEWLKESNAAEQALIQHWISNSVLEISAQDAVNTKSQFVGLKLSSTNGDEVEPFHLDANGKSRDLKLGQLQNNALNRELFVASASFDINKSHPSLNEISWQSDALIIAMQLSAKQDKEGKQLKLLISRQTAEQPHAEDPLITLRSCVICSRLGDLAIEEFRYTSRK